MRFETTISQGGASGVPLEVLEAHRPRHQEPPDLKAIERLQAIEKEITAAANSGNTSRLRMLRAEKKRIEDWQQQQSAALLARLGHSSPCVAGAQ
jgi:hypothetical protein